MDGDGACDGLPLITFIGGYIIGFSLRLRSQFTSAKFNVPPLNGALRIPGAGTQGESQGACVHVRSHLVLCLCRPATLSLSPGASKLLIA